MRRPDDARVRAPGATGRACPGRRVADALRAGGQLWEPAPGLLTLRGEALATRRELEARLYALCVGETRDEWAVPPALPLDVLARAGYFASFPQWLTVAAHLGGDADALGRIATSPDPGRAVAGALAAPTVALAPAVCYHVYAALAGTTLDAPRTVTAEGCCWRHEGGRHAALARGWAFTMREVVCVGSEADCAAFRERGIALAGALAGSLGLDGTLEQAEDPFFAPTARGRALLQRVKALKHELRLPVGDGETIAAASFNLHERFFGEAFDIHLPDGTPAHTACIAFGIERWLLAVLARRLGIVGPAPSSAIEVPA
ncbi:MAG TPA: hypothetical protein VNA89_16445 [Gemmatimonadaceae bacterium]|nr:hypothetical protein [Gemmatimonadaceae bacterium]